MFSFLFGNKKKKVEPQLEPVVTTLNDLHSKEADLEKRNEMLEAQIRAAGEAAVLANRAGQKQKALNLMQKRKMYEQQLETNNAAIMRLLMQRGKQMRFLAARGFGSEAIRRVVSGMDEDEFSG